MNRYNVTFRVIQQELSAVSGVRLYAGDRNHFYAVFKLEPTLCECSPKAVFQRGDISKLIDLTKVDSETFECIIPWEVMGEVGEFSVGIFGGDRILTNTVSIKVYEGCLCEGEPPQPPTPDWFDKVLEYSKKPAAIIGDNGNWFLWDIDTMQYIDSGQPSKGDKGEDGKEGSPGVPGQDGVGIQSIDMSESNELLVTLTDGTVYNLGSIPTASGKDGISPIVTLIDTKDGIMMVVKDASGEKSISISDGKDGANGLNGADGISPIVTFTSIDEGNVMTVKDAEGDKTITIFNGKDGETGPQGPEGKQGEQGPQGEQGEVGPEGPKGSDGENGKDGANGVDGKDGISVTHRWDGTTLIVTSASGTSSVNLKGESGEKGDKGDTGEQGPKGADGVSGDDGYTPQKGIDYWTDADKAEIKNYVDEAILGGAW